MTRAPQAATVRQHQHHHRPRPPFAQQRTSSLSNVYDTGPNRGLVVVVMVRQQGGSAASAARSVVLTWPGGRQALVGSCGRAGAGSFGVGHFTWRGTNFGRGTGLCRPAWSPIRVTLPGPPASQRPRRALMRDRSREAYREDPGTIRWKPPRRAGISPYARGTRPPSTRVRAALNLCCRAGPLAT